MSILDTFYTLFKADTTDLDKGLEDARQSSKKTAKDLETTDLAARKLGESIGRTIREFAGAAAAAFALHSMVDAMLAATTAADQLDEAAGRLDANIEDLSAWGDAVTKNGGSVDAFVGSVQNLNKNLATLEVTGKSRVAPFLKELGIDIESAAYKGKNATQLLIPLADAFDGMDKQKSLALGERLGLDLGTITTLQQGRKEVEEMIRREKELGVITKEQGEIAGKFGDQLDDTRHAFRSLWLEVSTVVVPVLTWFSKKFEQVAVFMRENKHFIVGIMIAIGSAIAVYAIPPLISMAAAALAAFAPFILIGLAVTALAVAFALLYDDIVNFMNGNDSLIGQMIAKWPIVGDIIYGIGDTFKWLADTVMSVGEIIIAIWQKTFQFMGEAAAALFSTLNNDLGIVGEVFKAIGELVGGIFNYWIRLIGQFLDKFGGIVGIAKAVGGAISGALGAAKGALGISAAQGPRLESGSGGAYGLAAGQQQLATAGATPLAAQTSNSIVGARSSNKTTNVKVDNVNVQTQATDAAGIAKSVGDSMGTQMRQAASNFDDGVAI